jgi:predicted transcriptional regulator
MTDQDASILKLSAGIVAAYVSNHTVDAADLSGLIRTVSASLAGLASGQATVPAAAGLKPVVPVERSVTEDFIIFICLEDGKRLRTLKRHLMGSFGLTPAQYRAKWGLPPTYPVTNPFP